MSESAESSARPKLKYEGGRYCSVVGCHSRQGREEVRFFHFPKRNPSQMELWIKAVKRINPDGTAWRPSPRELICGLHFRDKKPSNIQNHPDYVPSIFPTEHKHPKSDADLERHQRQLKRTGGLQALQEVSETAICLHQSLVRDTDTKEQVIDPEVNNDVNLSDLEESQIPTRTVDKAVETFHNPTKDSASSPISAIFLSTASKFMQRAQVSETVFKSCFGISRKYFSYCVKKIGSLLRSAVLNPDEQIGLFWMKLKTNESFRLSGLHFDVSDKSASKIFQRVLDAQFEVARKELWWHSREEVQAMMPESFKLLYPLTRVIIDASEIFIQTPSDVAASVLCWSSYKNHHTLKFLVGIAPVGMITFISKTYGGRVTDTHLTTDCGILELLEPNDLVMADKGFPHIEEDIVNRRGFLVMPPFKKGSHQFTAVENDACYKIASLRIHVERAIQRLKNFEILEKLENSLIPHIDKVLVVVANAVNHSPSLIKQDDEQNKD